MKKLTAALCLMLSAVIAHADVNLAVTCPGKVVDNKCRPHIYAVPNASSQVLSGGVWKIFGSLGPNETAQVATNDVKPGSESDAGTGLPGTNWADLPVSQIPKAPAGPAYVATPTAAPWQLYKGTSLKSKDHATEAICVAAARQAAITAKAAGEYLCKTSTGVSVKVVTAPVEPVPPVVVPPVTPPPATGKGFKARFGHYAWCMPGANAAGVSGYRIDLVEFRNAIIACIDKIAPEPAVRGLQVIVYPRALEGDTPGDYAAGRASLKAILDYAQSRGKTIMLGYQATVFGDFRALSDVFPTSWINDLGIQKLGSTSVPNYKGHMAKTWQRPTTDHVLAVLRAYADFDSHQALEMLTLGETAVALDEGNAGYSIAALKTELKYTLAEARKLFPTTVLRVSANDFGVDQNLVELYDFCETIGCAIGGPDVWPLDITQADRVFVGLDDFQVKRYKDRRDSLAWAPEAQWQSFTGQFSMQQLADAPAKGYTGTHLQPDGRRVAFPMPSMKNRYFIWYLNTTAGNASTKWETGILPVIRANPVASTTCPTSYPGCIQ